MTSQDAPTPPRGGRRRGPLREPVSCRVDLLGARRRRPTAARLHFPAGRHRRHAWRWWPGSQPRSRRS